jgi:ABC-type amino acid transport system permease subunit
VAEEIIQSQKPSKPLIWNNPSYRALFFQVLVLGGVLSLGYILVSNTFTNLERQGIASGFGFLKGTAGFSILMTLIDYSEEDSYFWAFVVSLLNTLLVAGIGIFFCDHTWIFYWCLQTFKKLDVVKNSCCLHRNTQKYTTTVADIFLVFRRIKKLAFSRQ